MAIRFIIKKSLLLVNFLIERRYKNLSQRSEVTVGDIVLELAGCKIFLIKITQTKINSRVPSDSVEGDKIQDFFFIISSSDVINVTKI